MRAVLQKNNNSSSNSNTSEKTVVSNTQNSLDAIKKSGKLRIGVDDSFPPMEFRDDQNQLVGYDVDLAKEAAKRLGVKAEFVPTDWSGIILALKANKFDVIWSAMTITDERAKEIDFSPAYLNDSQDVVVNF